jgi:hypothetical protein
LKKGTPSSCPYCGFKSEVIKEYEDSYRVCGGHQLGSCHAVATKIKGEWYWHKDLSSATPAMEGLAWWPIGMSYDTYREWVSLLRT